MKLDWMTLANYAEVNNGLLYIAGGAWDTINVNAPLEGAPDSVFAVIQGTLIIRLLFHSTEVDREHAFAVTIMDEDGANVGQADGAVRPERQPGIPMGWDTPFNMVLPLTGIPLPRPGLYTISLTVAGTHLGDRPFRVLKVF